MNQDQYLDEFKKITEQMFLLTKAKNTDYTGDASDPFKNFRMIENLGVTSAEAGIFTRMTDKMMRLATFLKGDVMQVADEKVEDTLEDLAVYSIILICYLRSKRN